MYMARLFEGGNSPDGPIALLRLDRQTRFATTAT